MALRRVFAFHCSLPAESFMRLDRRKKCEIHGNLIGRRRVRWIVSIAEKIARKTL